jgi:hypothetical protein
MSVPTKRGPGGSDRRTDVAVSAQGARTERWTSFSVERGDLAGHAFMPTEISIEVRDDPGVVVSVAAYSDTQRRI